MKRLIALLLVLCMLPAFQVYGADVGSFDNAMIAPASAYGGDVFSITFSFFKIPAPGLCGIDLEIDFDETMVEFVGATIVGYPEEGNWCVTGRVEDGKYLCFAFDDYKDAPTPIIDGNEAGIVVSFKSLPGVTGKAKFSVSKYGSVAGTVFDENGGTYIYGRGDEDRYVNIIARTCPNVTGSGWYIENGFLYVLPGSYVSDMTLHGFFKDAAGNIKKAGDRIFTGYSFYYGYYAPVTVIVATDVDFDGELTTADYLQLVSHIKGMISLTGNSFKAADLDGDGALTATDGAILKNALVGKGSPF